MKVLISLQFANTPLDPEKPLFCTVDASQVATCYLLFHLCEKVFIRKVFKNIYTPMYKLKIWDIGVQGLGVQRLGLVRVTLA